MNDAERSFGWLGAIARGVLVLGVGVGLLVVGPQAILTRVTGLDRSGRVALTTVWFSIWIVVLAVGLRRLQERRLI